MEELDYKVLLMKILYCIGSEAGHLYEDSWLDYDISEDESEQILNAFDEYYENR